MYPVVNLRRLGVGARAYVEGLEDAMVRTAGVYGVCARVRRAACARVTPSPCRRVPPPPFPPPPRTYWDDQRAFSSASAWLLPGGRGSTGPSLARFGLPGA